MPFGFYWDNFAFSCPKYFYSQGMVWKGGGRTTRLYFVKIDNKVLFCCCREEKDDFTKGHPQVPSPKFSNFELLPLFKRE